ncbi:MKI67 FHA domain-interacting nucleolar phosphoprotein [Anopheles merus]|uniref:MKI67 FHA domain-interacting nucleolar phosphoprotein n=1 Tax=Anopheles merus TaxID=30066 RepID=UPI001BE4462B|nr:MKI67 FHA domain-interacting nucleolar phosphoprotein [Anopheles merus]
MTVMETETTAKPVVADRKASAVGKEKKKHRRLRKRQRDARKRNAGNLQPKEQKKEPKKEKKAKQPAKISSKKGSGIVFIKHLPKGFYEDELRQFFEQFGEVMRVAVARSRKTQRSKGYGYVQFRFYEVADIAASAVNNYMMFNSVLKTSLLPKRMFNIPKNFGKAYDSKGEKTEAYQRWLKAQVKRANGYVGSLQSSVRCRKQISRLMRAEKELTEAGIEVAEVASCLSKLKQTATDLQQRHAIELARMPKPQPKEKPQKAKEETEAAADTNGKASDDEEDEAFTLLKPSDWQEVEPVGKDEPAKESKASAVKKAQEKLKELEQEKKGANKPGTTAAKGKENKKADTPDKKLRKREKLPLSKAKKPLVAGGGVSAKQAAKKEKLSLVKKNKVEKVSVESAAPVGKKAKRVDAVKEVKPAKVGKKVK